MAMPLQMSFEEITKCDYDCKNSSYQFKQQNHRQNI